MGKRIGIYGGSYDPVTNAHISVAEQLIENGYIDDVWILPCFKSLHGKELSPSAIRLNMLNLAIKDSKYKNQMKVCTWELDNEASGKTLDVINDMITYYKILDGYNKKVGGDYNTYHFIIGMDNADNIQKFAEWDKVISSAPFIVINRKGCESKLDWYKQEPHRFAEDINVPAMSSTMIRDAVRVMDKERLPLKFFDWCSPWVFAIIHEYGLYRIF